MARGSYYLTTPPCVPVRDPDLDLAREAVAADVLARHQGRSGRDVRFVPVVVEQGHGVERAARERGVAPQALVDEWAERYRRMLAALGVACAAPLRTTDARHQRVVKALFLKLFDQGDIYKDTRRGRYCARCEEFVSAGESGFPISDWRFRPRRCQGLSSSSNRRSAIGNGQSEIRGEAPRAPEECPLCGGPLTEAAAEGYFLRASKYQKRIVAHLRGHPGFLQPAGCREAALRAASEAQPQDPCLSRARGEWAIAVPPDLSHAMEAWFDALVSHLTVAGYLDDPQGFERTWPPDVQMLVPDELWTHALAWPALLAAAGLPWPERLVVRGRLVGSDGGPDASALAARFGADAVRYALLRAGDLVADGEISSRELVQLYNRDVAGRLLGLVDTTLGAIEEGRGGEVPRPGPLGSAEASLATASAGLSAATGRRIESLEVRGALDSVWAVVDQARGYAASAAGDSGFRVLDCGVGDAAGPSLRESAIRIPQSAMAPRARRLDTAVYVLAEVCRLLAYSLYPLLPGTAAAILDRLGAAEEGLPPSGRGQWGLMRPQARVRRGEPLGPRWMLPTE